MIDEGQRRSSQRRWLSWSLSALAGLLVAGLLYWLALSFSDPFPMKRNTPAYWLIISRSLADVPLLEPKPGTQPTYFSQYAEGGAPEREWLEYESLASPLEERAFYAEYFRDRDAGIQAGEPDELIVELGGKRTAGLSTELDGGVTSVRIWLETYR